jgi:hypothetical protein
MTIADMVLALDKRQGQEDARRCQRDPDHGRLTAKGNAIEIMCGVCGYSEPVSVVSENDRSR